MKLIDNYKDEVKKAIILLKELSSLNVINKEKIILATNYIKGCFIDYSEDNFKYNITTIPYISTYDFKEKVNIKEDVIIPLYITDYYQKEYLYEDTSETFTINYEIEGTMHTINNINAGDYELNLGKCSSVGEKEIWIQVIDKRGIKSQKLYKWVLIIDNTYEITEAQTYTITQQDLDKYGIKNTNSADVTDMTNTRLGLTELFKEIKGNGYKKAILLNGIYRVNYTNDRSQPIFIPSEFTVDLNNSTIKLNPENEESNLMINMKDCFDSHLINGTIEGDYAERLADGTTANDRGEGCNIIIITGNSKYTTVENCTISNATGHACGVNFGDCFARIPLNPNSVSFTNNVFINSNTGEEYELNGVMTSTPIDISSMLNYKYIMFGVLLMQGGMLGDSFYCFYNFYDENNLFIEQVVSHEYRHIKIPERSKYLKITLIGNNFTPSMTMHQLQNWKRPINCGYINDEFVNTRTCALVPGQYQDLRLKNLNFTRCGHSITPAPFDFEDGWQNSIDTYLTNCNIVEKAPSSTAGIIFCSGFNHVLENCPKLGRVIARAGVNGCVFRNNSNTYTIFDYDNRNRAFSGYGRVYNNSFKEGGCIFKTTEDNYRIIKNCTFYDSTSVYSNLKNCTFDFSYPRNSNVDMTIFLTDDNLYNCTINNSPDYALQVNNTKFIDSELNNCKFDVYKDVLFENTIINNLDTRPNDEGGSITFNNCNNIIDLCMPHFTHVTPTFTTNIENCNITLNTREMIHGINNNRTINIINSEINVIPENINIISIAPNKGFSNETYNIQNSVFNLNGGEVINGNFNNTITPPVIINNINNTINNGKLISDLALTKPNITINES